MAIKYLDEPTTPAQSQAVQPAGRIRYLDDTPSGFEQFQQEAQPEPIRATPMALLDEATPTTSSPSFEPLSAQEPQRPSLAERAKLASRVGFSESGFGLLARTPVGRTLKDLPAGTSAVGGDIVPALYRLFDVPTTSEETLALRQQFDELPSAESAPELAATVGGYLAGSAPSPENIIPAGRGATLLRRAANTGLITGGTNALLDIGRQELDIAQGLQDEKSFGQLITNFGAGFLVGSVLHLSLEGLGKMVQRVAERRASGNLTPEQLAELDALERAAQEEIAKRTQAIDADAAPRSPTEPTFGELSTPVRDLDQITSSIPLDEAGRRATGAEPTGIRLPDILTAEEAAAQGLPFQRGAVTRTPADEAAVAAGRQAEDATILAQRENTMQELANELSRLTGESFETVVARRAGKTDAQWLRELNSSVDEARLNVANREADLAATPPEPEDIPLPGDIRYLETANREAAEQTTAFNQKVLRITNQFRRDGIPLNAETRRAASALARAETPAEYNLLRQGIYDRFAPKAEQTAPARTTFKSLQDLEVPGAAPETPQARPVFNVANRVREVSALTPQEFRTTMSGYTDEAHSLGLSAKNADDVAALAAAEQAANAKAQQLSAARDFENGMIEVNRAQYFREAREAATGTGSAGRALREADPNFKAPVPEAESAPTQAAPEPASAPADTPTAPATPRPAEAPQTPATPEPVSPAAETAPTPKAIELYTVKEWLADIESGKKLEDLPTPKVVGDKQLKAFNETSARLRDISGRINITPGGTTLAGAGLGGVTGAGYGITQGDTVEERLENAAKYGFIGLGVGAGVGSSAGRALGATPIRRYKTPALKKVETMLIPKKEPKDMFGFVRDAAGNFRLAFNTAYAKIGQAQRQLFKEAGRKFTPNRYYDLERQFEQIAGVPAKAEGEVEILQTILNDLPKADQQHLDPYLVLARIEDRLVKTGEENARLIQNVANAEAEYAAAQTAAKAKPNVTNAQRVISTKEQYRVAVDKMNKEFDRKRVGDWSINEARQGLKDLEATIGPEAFARIQKAGQDFQTTMRRALQLQVDAGRMTQGLMDRILASNDFYAGFKVLKYFEDEAEFLRGGGIRRIPSSEQLAKKITGIDDTDVRIESPFALAAEQVYKGKILAEKNILMRKLATLSNIDPEGKFVRLMGENEDPRKGYKAVSYFVQGKPRRMELSNELAQAVEGLDRGEADVILAGLGKISSLFKLGATGLSIPFNLANAFVFDPLRLATISRYGFRGPQDLAWTLMEWPKALWSSARGNIGSLIGVQPDELYNTWLRSGAAVSTFARVMSPESFSARLPKDIKIGEAVMDKGLGIKPVLKLASLMSNTLEETTKIWGLQRAMRLERLDKLSPIERARKWTEIVTELRNYTGSPDFARFGRVMRPLNIVMPFLNPRWQGFSSDFGRLNPFIRGNAGDSAAAWTRLMLLAGGPTVALAYYNLSSEQNAKDYEQLPQWEKDNYWNIPLNKGTDGEPTILDTGEGYYFKNKDGQDIRGYMRIPKREFPKIVANVLEDFAQYAKGNKGLDAVAANFAESFVENASPVNIEGEGVLERVSSAASGLNPGFRIPLEEAFNENFFTRRPIVPQGKEDASPELQFEESTPQVYRDVANRLPDITPEPFRSPARLQHMTESFTGGFSRQFAPPQVSEGNPAAEAPAVLRRFFRSERTEQGDLQDKAKEARRGRADQRITAQEEGGRIAEAILAAPTREAKLQIVTDARQSGVLTPEVEDQVKEELQDAQRGLTYEDRTVKRSFTVIGGFRARYLYDKINSLPPGERAAYVIDQKRKGIITPEVEKQLIQLFSQAQK